MKNLKEIIQEKLVITKDTKEKYQTLGTNSSGGIDIPKDILIDSIKSAFISIFKNVTYKLVSNGKYYSIKRSELDWKDIIEILNTEYNHNLDPKYADENSNGDYKRVMRLFMSHIENLLNMRTVYINIGDERIELKGKDIYWNDWVKYRDKYNLRGY